MKSPTPTPVRFAAAFEPTEWRTGTVDALTNDGLFIAASSLWPPKTPLLLVVTLPGDRLPVRLSGEVVSARASSPSGMSVVFAPAAAADAAPRERLARAVRAAKPEPTQKVD